MESPLFPGLQQNTDPWSADPLTNPLKRNTKKYKKIQSIVQIKFINIMSPEVPRLRAILQIPGTTLQKDFRFVYPASVALHL